jgi:hypothetical protein
MSRVLNDDVIISAPDAILWADEYRGTSNAKNTNVTFTGAPVSDIRISGLRGGGLWSLDDLTVTGQVRTDECIKAQFLTGCAFQTFLQLSGDTASGATTTGDGTAHYYIAGGDFGLVPSATLDYTVPSDYGVLATNGARVNVFSGFSKVGSAGTADLSAAAGSRITYVGNAVDDGVTFDESAKGVIEDETGVLVGTQAAQSKVIYFSSAGRDTDPGTIDRPKATPNGANSAASAGDTISCIDGSSFTGGFVSNKAINVDMPNSVLDGQINFYDVTALGIQQYIRLKEHTTSGIGSASPIVTSGGDDIYININKISSDTTGAIVSIPGRRAITNIGVIDAPSSAGIFSYTTGGSAVGFVGDSGALTIDATTIPVAGKLVGFFNGKRYGMPAKTPSTAVTASDIVEFSDVTDNNEPKRTTFQDIINLVPDPPPPGKLVKFARDFTSSDQNTTSTSFVNTDLAIAYEPEFASSTLIIEFSAYARTLAVTGSSVERYGNVQLFLDGGGAGGIAIASEGRVLDAASSNNANSFSSSYVRAIVPAQNTNARTYRVRFSSGSSLVNFQLSGTSVNPANLTITEISA